MAEDLPRIKEALAPMPGPQRGGEGVTQHKNKRVVFIRKTGT